MRNWKLYILFLVLYFSNQNLIFAQINDSITVDFGFGPYEKITKDSLQKLIQDSIFIVEYTVKNELQFNNPEIFTDKKLNQYNCNFYLTDKFLCMYSNGKEISKIEVDGHNLCDYFNFTYNSDFYEYFVYYNKNAFGDLNRLKEGVLVKNKKEYISIPEQFSTSNPSLIFVNSSISNSLNFIAFDVYNAKNSLVFTLKNAQFILNPNFYIKGYWYRNYVKIDKSKSKWPW